MSETWENVYDGFDSPYGTTKWIMEAAKRVVPRGEPSPACKKNGHSWVTLGEVLMRGATVHCCKRCAKRGLVVLRTDS